MDITGLIIFLAIGAVAGWLAGNLMKGSSFGLLGNIVVGIVGAVIGGFVFSLLGLAAVGIIGSIISATIGAALLLFIVGLLKKKGQMKASIKVSNLSALTFHLNFTIKPHFIR